MHSFLVNSTFWPHNRRKAAPPQALAGLDAHMTGDDDILLFGYLFEHNRLDERLPRECGWRGL